MVHDYDCVKPHSTIVWLFTDFLQLTSKLDHIMSGTSKLNGLSCDRHGTLRKSEIYVIQLIL